MSVETYILLFEVLRNFSEHFSDNQKLENPNCLEETP